MKPAWKPEFEDIPISSINQSFLENEEVMVVSKDFYDDYQLLGLKTLKKNKSIEGKLRDSLKPGLKHGVDYVFIQDPRVWDKMKKVCKPLFRRHIIKKGIKAELFVELYPFSIRLYRTNAEGNIDEGNILEFFISKQSTWLSFLNTMQRREPTSAEAGVPRKMRLWRQPLRYDGPENEGWILLDRDTLSERIGHTGYEPCGNINLLLETEGKDGWARKEIEKDWRQFEVNDVLDAQNKEGKWFESTIRDVKETEIFVHFRGCSNMSDEWINKESDRLAARGTHSTGPVQQKQRLGYGYRSNRKVKPDVRGIVGLRNLGNTCYMNSSLQCLLQLEQLGNYFYDEAYRSDVNRQNPLGWQGQVADTFGEFLKNVFSDEYSTIAPKSILGVMRQINAQFAGFNQHDSQEFLSFLLDALHEDLNRVQDKPQTQEIEGRGRPDTEVAKEAWETHLLRHDSFLLDTFCGQFRSIITCPTCNRVSKKFDPFWMLTVPLPENSHKILEITWMGHVSKKSTSSPLVLGLKCKANETMKGIRAKFAEKSGLSPKNLTICDIWNKKVYRTFPDDFALMEIASNDSVHIFQIHQFLTEEDFPSDEITAWMTVPISHNQQYKNTPSYKSSSFSSLSNPMFLRLPCGVPLSPEQLEKCVQKLLEPYMDPEWVDETEPLYSIRLQDKSGRSCYHCEWSKYCSGCEIEKPITLKRPVKIESPLQIAIVWTKRGSKLFKHEDYSDPERDETAPDEGVGAEGRWKKKAEPPVKLEACLDLFEKEETLDEMNQWYCPHCKDFKCAQKQMDIWKIPEICIVHLKRFSSFGGVLSQKNDRSVLYPLEIDFKKWVLNERDSPKDCKYQLCGVVQHLGGMGGGHYIASVKSQVNGKWYLMNDDSIKRILPEDAQSSDAYMLFYSKIHD